LEVGGLSETQPESHGYQLTPPRRTRLAVASLVCGLIVCFPPASLLAIVFGLIALKKTMNRRFTGRGLAIGGIVLGIGGLWGMNVVSKTLTEQAVRVACEINLKQIGWALKQYSNENHGSYPPDLGSLIKAQDIHGALEFVCPATRKMRPEGLTYDQVPDWVNKNSDYVYNAAGLAGDVDPAFVLVYEKDTNHDDGMVSLVFEDGHVTYMPRSEAHAAIERGNKLRQAQSH
jgi:hypothetical protein